MDGSAAWVWKTPSRTTRHSPGTATGAFAIVMCYAMCSRQYWAAASARGSSKVDNTFSSSEFQWDEQVNEYRCPAGHALGSDRRKFRNPRTRVTKADTIVYRASQLDWESCAMKDRCCPNTPFRKIARSIHEAARDEARRIATTPEYRQKVEMRFAHLKLILKLDRLRLRGPTGAHDEFLLLAATGQDLRRMAKWLTPGRTRNKLAAA